MLSELQRANSNANGHNGIHDVLELTDLVPLQPISAKYNRQYADARDQ